MTTFTVALTTVGMMLLYAVPGFIFVKTKKIGTENIASFAVVLLLPVRAVSDSGRDSARHVYGRDAEEACAHVRQSPRS